jgi:hypothetical protein
MVQNETQKKLYIKWFGDMIKNCIKMKQKGTLDKKE